MGLLPDELHEVAARYPDRVAVDVVDGDTLTFGAWDARSDTLARTLVDGGVRPGDRVMILLPAELADRFGLGYVAAHKAGAVVVPVNPRYAPRELEHIAASADPALVVTGGDQEARARALEARVLGDDHWEEATGGDEEPFRVARRGSDLAEILYTSGTTGLPKGVTSTHDSVLANEAAPLEPLLTLLHSAPLPTTFGSLGALIMPLRLAMTSIALPRFDTERFAALIEERRPTWLLMVPAQILLLLESGALAGRETGSVRMVMFGSAPTPPHALPALAEAFPRAALVNGYGLTEGGGSTCTMPPGELLRRPGSVGKPVAGASVRVVDDDGAELPTGEVGEVTIRLAAGERSYWNDPEGSARTWRDGWVHTGDLGYFDPEGYLYLVDRKKDMINRGGYNVYSIEVESALYEHPDVAEAAVVGIPHDVLGHDVCAVVRLRDGSAPLDVGSVRAFLADRLADYKLPRRLVVRDAPLPRSGMHKVDKKALLAEVTGRAATC
ncbi:MAG TPA: AMP-binding protein [Acidimicrobiia bacterium]|nr:AMP-binding protein [Acidimicrobiia bacterium]